MGQLGPPKPPFFSLDNKIYFTNIFTHTLPRGAWVFRWTFLWFLLSHLQSFVSLRYRKFLLGTENAVGGGVGLWQCMTSCLFRLGYPYAKFQNTPVIFYWSRILKKMGQLGPPKHPFLSLDKKKLFHQYFLLDGPVDPIRPNVCSL